MNTADHPAVWIPVIVLVTIMVVACLIDIVRRPRVEHLPKAAWALIVVLVVPLGAVAYLTLGRGRGTTLSDGDL
jgi:ABC transporter related